MKKGEKLIGIIMIATLIIATIFVTNWSHFGYKARSGQVLSGPGIIRFSPKEDRVAFLQIGEYVAKGGEIFFKDLEKKDLSGWDVISLPE